MLRLLVNVRTNRYAKSAAPGLLEATLQEQITLTLQRPPPALRSYTVSTSWTGKLKPGHLSKFIAALASRLFSTPQPRHRHSRSASVSSSFFQPQCEHNFEEANQQRSAFTDLGPYQRHLYSSLFRKSDVPASAIALTSRRLRIMPATFSVSTTTRPHDLAIAVVAL